MRETGIAHRDHSEISKSLEFTRERERMRERERERVLFEYFEFPSEPSRSRELIGFSK